jgi:hypothetical protein
MYRLSNYQFLSEYDPFNNLIQKIIHEYGTKLGLPCFLHINRTFYCMAEYLQT